HALVVQAEHRDHVGDVRLALDPARGPALLAREHRVEVDPALRVERAPDVLGEAEVGDVVAVQMTDLARADAEGPLPPPARARAHAGPGGDLLGDPLVCPSDWAHSNSFRRCLG